MTTDLAAIREAHEAAQLQLETAEAKRLLSFIGGQPLPEAWGDFVDPRGYLYDNDDFGWRPLGWLDNIADRGKGQDAPVFETEYDLAEIRAMGRMLTTRFPAGLNIQENLTNYTIGTGLTYEAAPVRQGGEQLTQLVQRCLDLFLDANDWIGDLEREVHERSRADGEVFMKLEQRGSVCKLNILEPSQITEPQNKRDLEDYYGVDYPANWFGGILTPEKDHTDARAYHIVYDGSGHDWEFADAAHMEHIKRNVPRNVKRGVSDFYPVKQFLQGAEKLLVNTNAGAAVQAAIAFIREHPTGTTASQAQSLKTSAAYDSYQRHSPLHGNQTRYVQKFEPGTILDVGGQKYTAGPMGAGQSAPNFVVVIQAALRYVGVRWSMPEYMISGDASNNSYASTLMAESPFVKSREADQQFYISRFKRLLWKVVALYHQAGYFGDVAWEELEAAVDINIDAPEVASRNKAEETAEWKTLMDLGVMSAKTVASKAGLDYDEEVANGAKPAAPVGFGGAPTGAGFPESLREDCGTGAGGFKAGNECAGGGGGSSDKPASSKASPKVQAWAEKKFKDPEKAKAFAEWFGDSKVVDANGEPLTVYHGTSDVFTSFDVEAGDDKGNFGAGPGVFFTETPEVASGYALQNLSLGDKQQEVEIQSARNELHRQFQALSDKTDTRIPERDSGRNRWMNDLLDSGAISRDEYDSVMAADDALRSLKVESRRGLPSPNIVPAHLSLKNPKIIDANRMGWEFIVPETLPSVDRNVYDGVIFKNIRDSGDTSEIVTTTYFAFKPTQIKSATGNRGTFDPNSPKINESMLRAAAVLLSESDYKNAADALRENYP